MQKIVCHKGKRNETADLDKSIDVGYDDDICSKIEKTFMERIEK